MATIKDIADKLGISVSTVSKGLNGASDISESLRQSVLDTAVEMGYTTKRMKKEGHKKLCIFIENMDYETNNQFGYDLVLGFRQSAYHDKWEVTVEPITSAFQLEEKYDTYMLKNGYSGAFLMGFTLSDPWMAQLSTTTIPTVLLDNYIRKNPHVAYVGTDSFEGIDTAVEHLASLGHCKIAFLNGPRDSMVFQQRMQAYIDSLSAHNLPYDEQLTAYCCSLTENLNRYVTDWIRQGATAIVCGSDIIASGVIDECHNLGYQVPADISVIGFDDLPISTLSKPPLTTVGQNRIELGKCGYML